MRLQMTIPLLACLVAMTALATGVFVVSRIAEQARYSMREPPADPEVAKRVETWRYLEQEFQRRTRVEAPLALARDPMWPTYVPRPANQAASPAGKPVPAPARDATAAPPAPRPAPPRLLALLLDHAPRALLQFEGRSAMLGPGQRLGALRVLDVRADGVAVEWNGARRLLRVHAE